MNTGFYKIKQINYVIVLYEVLNEKECNKIIFYYYLWLISFSNISNEKIHVIYLEYNLFC